MTDGKGEMSLSGERDLKHVSKSTPNLSYPSRFVDKSESARLAAWWEESPFPVRSQRFTFHSHSSGQKVVLRKGQSMYEVSKKGNRRHSMNFADLEALMGAVSGSEEETEAEDDERNSSQFLQPYQALAEEMDSHSGNRNQSNSKALSPKYSSSKSNYQRTWKRLAASEETLTRSSSAAVHSIPKSAEMLHASVSTPYLNGSVPASKDWSAMSPSLESVIQAQFLRNASLTSLQFQKQSSNPLPGDALRTPKRLQRATKSAVKRREQQRHSWAGNPNPLSNSVLKLVKSGGERSSWIGILDDLPVIPEDKGKEREKNTGAVARHVGSG